MLSNTLFIIYMIMCFLSLQAITLALIIRSTLLPAAPGLSELPEILQ